jgi:hypothetical protein
MQRYNNSNVFALIGYQPYVHIFIIYHSMHSQIQSKSKDNKKAEDEPLLERGQKINYDPDHQRQ